MPINPRYYLYRHIRLDKNEVFYIGIGTKPKSYASHETEYGRAYSKYRRNNYWKNIVNKTSYEVEIMMELDTKEQACEKEKEFITIYGRRNLNKGTLCNLTDGGEGTIGYNLSDQQKKNMSLARIGTGKGANNPMYGKKASMETRIKQSNAKKGKLGNRLKAVTQHSISGEVIKNYPSITFASSETGIIRTSINNNIHNRSKSAGGFVFKSAA